MDKQIFDLLSALAAIVNRASRAESTSAEAVKVSKVSKVPTSLLARAKHVLADWKDSEYGTDAVRHACGRSLGE